MTINHRGAMLSAAIIALLCGAAPAQPNTAFPLGVAAGDVLQTQAIVWTWTPAPATLHAELATDPAFSSVLQSVSASTSAMTGNTAKVHFSGLLPGSRYFYRFVIDGGSTSSRAGMFRTLPGEFDSAPCRFVFTGDSNAAQQPFRILADAAAESADFWFWYGDTIYGDAPAGGLGVAETLDDYRAKYRQNLADPFMQDMLASTPAWTGWDDHEVSNDYDGAELEPELSQAQQSAAYQAFFEHMPIRPTPDPADPHRTYRSFRHGALAEFFILDARQYRTADAARVVGGGISTLDPYGRVLPIGSFPMISAIESDQRTMLGAEQLAWLKNGVTTSTARYKFIINNVPFTSLLVYPQDRWDGYNAERFDLLRAIDLAGTEGVIILTTDTHANLANPDITWFLRHTFPRPLSRGFIIPEFVAGPIGTDTFGQEIEELVAGIFPGVLRPIGSYIGRLLESIAMFRITLANGLIYAESRKFAYLVADVADDHIELRYRGIEPDPAGTDRAVTLFSITLDGRGRVSSFAPGTAPTVR